MKPCLLSFDLHPFTCLTFFLKKLFRFFTLLFYFFRRARIRYIPAFRRGGPRREGAQRGAGPNLEKVGGPTGWENEGWGARRVGARNFALFVPSPAPIFAFFFSLRFFSCLF